MAPIYLSWNLSPVDRCFKIKTMAGARRSKDLLDKRTTYFSYLRSRDLPDDMYAERFLWPKEGEVTHGGGP